MEGGVVARVSVCHSAAIRIEYTRNFLRDSSGFYDEVGFHQRSISSVQVIDGHGQILGDEAVRNRLRAPLSYVAASAVDALVDAQAASSIWVGTPPLPE